MLSFRGKYSLAGMICTEDKTLGKILASAFLIIGLLFLVVVQDLRIKLVYIWDDKQEKLEINLDFMLIGFSVSPSWPFMGGSSDSIDRGKVKESKDGVQTPFLKELFNFFYCRSRHLVNLMRLFLRFTRWQNLHFIVRFGFKDAALTGMSAGTLWAIGGIIQPLIQQNFIFENSSPLLDIQPTFDEEQLLLIKAYLQFRIRLYQIFYLFLLSVPLILPSRGEINRWTNIRFKV